MWLLRERSEDIDCGLRQSVVLSGRDQSASAFRYGKGKQRSFNPTVISLAQPLLKLFSSAKALRRECKPGFREVGALRCELLRKDENK